MSADGDRGWWGVLASGVVLAASVALGACGSSGTTTSGTTVPPATSAPPATRAPSVTTTAPPPSASPPPSSSQASAAPPCLSRDLTASLTAGSGGAAGSMGVTLDLLNSGTTTCTISGYPGVSFVAGAAGTQVGAAATRTPATTGLTVTLPPGHAAEAALRIVDSLNYDQSTCRLTQVRGFRVYPPGETAALFVASAQKACADPRDVTLNIGPVVAGPAAGGT
jgi:hypothetical protein